ncbi:bck1 resistance to osmotic shock [Salix suchowensis]|nr:bck1 resistance to osmotic shock [Salix suchowensis]
MALKLTWSRFGSRLLTHVVEISVPKKAAVFAEKFPAVAAVPFDAGFRHGSREGITKSGHGAPISNDFDTQEDHRGGRLDTPIRNLVAQSYGESPDNYAAECASLQRCRQDAVRGAGSDIPLGSLKRIHRHNSSRSTLQILRPAGTARAALLRDTHRQHALCNRRLTEQIGPGGLKRAFYYFRTCAGMLTYINENFLHAPSTDLSRDVVRFLINIIIAQATEVFIEKCTDEKKASALVAKIGAQAAALYTILTEDVKEFMGKGIFDRNWVTLLQIKSKYFSSLAQYHRGLADSAAGKHGDALVRFTQSESLAKEASRTAATFGSVFVTNMSPNLPADAGSSIQERTKAHLTICSEKKAEATRENDLIYNAILPSAEALPVIDKLSVATPISIQDVYGSPEVQKVIGPDLFVRLIPLSVHESASVYSEEKAKLVRGEVENAETAEGEVRSALDALAVKDGIVRFRAMAEGELAGRGYPHGRQAVQRGYIDCGGPRRRGGSDGRASEEERRRQASAGDNQRGPRCRE